MGPGSSYRTVTRRWTQVLQVLCLLFALYRLSLAVTGMCQAGTYLAENGTCVKCPEGSYTNHSNQLTQCLDCRICESAGLVKVNSCTPTKNTECECEAGKCLPDNFTEHCVPCPRSEASQQTPTAMSGNLAPSRDPSRPEFHKTQFPRQDATLSSPNKQPGNIWTEVGIGVAVFIVLVGLVMLVLYIIYLRKKDKSQGFLDFWKNSLCSVWAWCRGQPRTASEIGQNDLNENLTEIETYDKRQGHDGRLLGTVDRERELEIQAQAPLLFDTVQVLGDPKQVPTGAGQSQERRRRLVPVEGTNGAESFRIFFNDIPNIVPISCWKPLMRHLGLTDNDIYAAERENSTLHEQMYKMLVTWQEKKGTAASVNTLLETLEAQGQRMPMEVIQEKLVKSGKFIHEDDGAGSVVSQEEETLKPAGLPLLP